MFMHLHGSQAPNSQNIRSIPEHGYTLYRQNVFEQFKNTARDAVLGCIRRERGGNAQDRDLLQDCISVFVELGSKLKGVGMTIYKDDFHKSLVAQTKQYYKQKSRFWMDQKTCPEYLIQSEKCVQDEEGRLASYINKYSNDGLMTAVRDQLLKNHQKELLHKRSGINSILERTRRVDDEARQGVDVCNCHQVHSF